MTTMTTRNDLWDDVPKGFWPNLAAAIIYKACMDYEDRLVSLYFETDPRKSRDKYGDFREVYDFFGSDWYYMLTDIDHQIIIRELNRKAAIRMRTQKIKRKHIP